MSWLESTVRSRRRGINGLGRTSLIAIALTVLSVACGNHASPDFLLANGRIEADEVRVAAKIGGRVRQVLVQESDQVEEGQILVAIGSEEWEARMREAQAAVAAARSTVIQASTRLSVLDHHAGIAREDFQRMTALYEAGAASGQQRDQAENALREAEGQLEVARSEVKQGEAGLEAARANLEVARTQLAETQVLSPLDGVVLLRLVEEGEVVQPGQPMFIVIDPQELFLKVYVSEEDIGKVRIGSPVRVKVDGFPDRDFEGFVSEVAQQAEFTPRDIHMPEERTQLVFAVKVRLRETGGILKPGMLADAEIHWKEKGAVSVGSGGRPSPRREALR